MNYFSRLLFTSTVCLCAWGQELQPQIPEAYIALLRSDVQTRKTDVIRQNLTLSESQARKFWPLQRSYENNLSKLGDRRLDVIREYVNNWDSLNDEAAGRLGRRLLDYHKTREDLHRKYFDRISKEISPTIAAKYFQIETQLEYIIDLEIASSVPLVK